MHRSVTVELSPKTRFILRDQGFDMSSWSDQQLAAIEYTAKALAAGEKVFVAEDVRPFVRCLCSVFVRN